MLKDIISFLKTRDENEVPPIGFNNPHSYRGYYNNLAFESTVGVTVKQMLEDCSAAMSSSFVGWKGGEYIYNEYTTCWLSQEGVASGQSITPFLLSLMFGEVPSEDINNE